MLDEKRGRGDNGERGNGCLERTAPERARDEAGATRNAARRTAMESGDGLLSPREMASELGFLVTVTGRRKGGLHRLDGPRSLIGRSRGVQVFVDDSTAGGHHASIRCERVGEGGRGEFVLRDLDSENGTYVNGRRITSMVVLKDGDVIRVGETELVFKRV